MYTFATKSSLLLVLTSTFGYPTPDEIIPSEDRKDNIDERGSFYQGDIKLPPQTKAGIIGDNYRWPGAQLVYEIGPNFAQSEKDLIAQAMQEISSKTCITFRAKTSSDVNYVSFQNSASGCWSYLGQIGGKQALNLEPACFYNRIGTTVHEMTHALGFEHEHSRADRDRYVTIDYSNVQPGTESAFEKVSNTRYDSMGVPYDYGSIMHYSSWAFAKDYAKPTIIPKISTVAIGQRVALSRFDVIKLKRMYACP